MIRYEDALQACLEYFKGDDLAADVFLKKYALKDKNGNLLEKTPDDMHKRLAKEFARIESKHPSPISEEEIYELLKNFRYIVPQGSPMAGIGNSHQTMSLSNCFTIASPVDSYGGIFLTDQQQAQLMKRRGGVGFDISTIRPQGSLVNNAAKTSTGIGPFMERFSSTCREVAMNNRRGALMLTCSIHHPEIETFINIKRDRQKVTGANISIRFSDEFMKAVEDDAEYEQRWPVDADTPTVSHMVSAKKIWNMFCESAHECAEPGALFWDTATRNTPSDAYSSMKSVACNPCSEIILSANDSCRLMLVNLFSFVKNPFTSKASFDYKKFSEVSNKAQRLMDDLVDLEIECLDEILTKLEKDPEPDEIKNIEISLWMKIKKAALDGRRTGLGITGLGDALAALGVPYGAEKAIKITEKIYKELCLSAYEASYEMGKERGPFLIADAALDIQNDFVRKVQSALLKRNPEFDPTACRRNIALTTTAPAGSVSMLTQTTSGIEPLFLTSYTRRRKVNPEEQGEVKVDFVDDLGDKWQNYTVHHPKLQVWMDITGKSDIEDSPYHKATTADIAWEDHVETQAAAQKWVCHAISKTCNLPKDTPVDVVKDVYMDAWKSGCKGFTIYRDGCRTGVLVSEDDRQGKENASKREEYLPCDVYHMTVNGEKWNFFVGKLDDKPYEIFAGLAKYVTLPKRVKTGRIRKNRGKVSRYDLHYGEEGDETIVADIGHVFENPIQAAFTRSISLSLRHQVPINFVVEQLQKGSEKDDNFFSLSRGLSRVLKNYIVDGTTINGKKCKECGESSLSYQEGCLTCMACGNSKCG